jgi:hypothetical protein
MEMTSNLAYRAYQAYIAYAAYPENDTPCRREIGPVYTETQMKLSVIKLHGISEHSHLPINGYFDIRSNFAKTKDHPSSHQFLFRSAYVSLTTPHRSGNNAVVGRGNCRNDEDTEGKPEAMQLLLSERHAQCRNGDTVCRTTDYLEDRTCHLE